jgi:hypothetical protein
MKTKAALWHCVEKFYPMEDIVGKKVSKLKSAAELRTGDGVIITGSFLYLTFNIFNF